MIYSTAIPDPWPSSCISPVPPFPLHSHFLADCSSPATTENSAKDYSGFHGAADSPDPRSEADRLAVEYDGLSASLTVSIMGTVLGTKSTMEAGLIDGTVDTSNSVLRNLARQERPHPTITTH